MTNSINWFEIPVTDFARAKKFYEALFDAQLETMEAMGMTMAFLPADLQNGGIGGGIVKGEGYEPSTIGSLVYLNGGDDLDVPLARVEPAGGQIVLQKMAIGENGFMAYFIDTEGNKIGLHSMK
ncbi:MAG: VOC family protein [Bacteroidia bacterium]